MVEVFGRVAEVLRPDGTLWLNLGDCYSTGAGRVGECPGGGSNGERGRKASPMTQPNRMPLPGLKPKDLIGVPWRVAFALQAAGWYLRASIVWAKPNPMPESIRDRPTRSHEMIFLLAHPESRGRYYYDCEAVREPAAVGDHARAKVTRSESHVPGSPIHSGLLTEIGPEGGRNLRDVWTLATQPCAEAHFATFPERIPEIALAAGTSALGVCSRCGAPWARVVEATGWTIGASWHDHAADAERGAGQGGGERTARMNDGSYRRATVGWEPRCECGSPDRVPALVLDPFAGAGTTLLVAARMGLRSVGVEANPEYLAMASRRVGAEAEQRQIAW